MSVEISIHRDDIIKEGWMVKQSKHIKTWRRRWCVLTPQYLCSFTSKGALQNPTDYIRMCDCITVKAAMESRLPSSFHVVTNDRVLHFMADTEAEITAWIGCIGRTMAQSLMMSVGEDFESCNSFELSSSAGVDLDDVRNESSRLLVASEKKSQEKVPDGRCHRDFERLICCFLDSDDDQ